MTAPMFGSGGEPDVVKHLDAKTTYTTERSEGVDEVNVVNEHNQASGSEQLSEWEHELGGREERPSDYTRAMMRSIEPQL